MEAKFVRETFRNLGIEIPRTYVETGAFKGDGIQRMLELGWFTQIYSIELYEDLFRVSSERFKNVPHVHVIEGESADILEQISPQLTRPTLFYLDAHYSGGKTAKGPGGEETPVIRELEILAKRTQADVIVVDDMRLMGIDSWSGSDNDPNWPRTRFDWRHVTVDAMKAAYSREGYEFMMATTIDRLIIHPKT